MVSGTRPLSDTILYLRDALRSNVTDPISSTRPSGQKFVMTSYPKRDVVYPIITVTSVNVMDKKTGQRSEKSVLEITLEIRIWAKNEKQKQELFDDVYYYLRTAQFGTNSAELEYLYDFSLSSAVDVDEDGLEGIKSKIMQIKYMNVAI
jgi:hypothetical protein